MSQTGPAGQLAEFLRRNRNPDGGWGYYPGKSSRLEPTSWALMALGDADGDVLRTWPAAEGLLLERRGGEPNYAFHGIALLAFRFLRIEHQEGSATLLRGLQRVKGIALEPSEVNRQNNSLQAWSWREGTFSWVEPTAWSLLALKRWAAAPGAVIDRQRISEAEALLIDRACASGGWNHGSSNVFGKELRPYVPTTAMALLALQDLRSEPVFTRGLEYLVRSADTERSSHAMSLALLALRVLGHAAPSVEAALAAQVPTAIALGQQLSIAQGLAALRADHDSAFTVR